MKRLLFVMAVIFGLTACDKFDEIIPAGLTEAEVVQGLKSALIVGSDTAVQNCSRLNGFYSDQLIKILLPEDAKILVENIALIPGGSQMLESVILRMNRAAEDAASQATPIFVDAVTSMSFSDAFAILNGTDSAATNYLRQKTFTPLTNLFLPVVSASLNKELIGGVSTNEAWAELSGAYNTLANSLVGQLSGLTPVNTQLDAHVTNKGLNGLFYKLAMEEKSIRNDPWARVNDILKKVFGNG
ncbi:MAG: DUF4197 domain-containing protein [Bacteroidales bacterium]|nr:DUF4197 domain-containing protein [Bacteroidales bacterium]